MKISQAPLFAGDKGFGFDNKERIDIRIAQVS